MYVRCQKSEFFDHINSRFTCRKKNGVSRYWHGSRTKTWKRNGKNLSGNKESKSSRFPSSSRMSLHQERYHEVVGTSQRFEQTGSSNLHVSICLCIDWCHLFQGRFVRAVSFFKKETTAFFGLTKGVQNLCRSPITGDLEMMLRGAHSVTKKRIFRPYSSRTFSSKKKRRFRALAPIYMNVRYHKSEFFDQLNSRCTCRKRNGVSRN